MSAYLQRLVRPAGGRAERATGLQEIAAVVDAAASPAPAAPQAPHGQASLAPGRREPSLDTVLRWVAGPAAGPEADTPSPAAPAPGMPSQASPPHPPAIHAPEAWSPQPSGVMDRPRIAPQDTPGTWHPVSPRGKAAPAPVAGVGPDDGGLGKSPGGPDAPASATPAGFWRPAPAAPTGATASRPAPASTAPARAPAPVTLHIGTVELRVQAPAPVTAPVTAPKATPAPAPAARPREPAADPMPFHPARHHLRWN